MPERPLLTIAIPTYNRSAELALSLTYLAPQLQGVAGVEVLIRDNASTDDTANIVRRFMARGLRCDYLRRAENAGPDANFLGCYNEAQGRFVWILSDDDVLLAGGLERILEMLSLPEVDIVFAQAQGFIRSPEENLEPDPKAPAKIFTHPADFINAVNFKGDLALTSALIVNKERVESFAHPSFELGARSNLLQLGWVFTCIKHMRKGVVLNRGLLATCEKAPSRPFDMVEVFGKHWKEQTERFIGRGSPLYELILRRQLDSWFVGTWMHMRRQGFARTTPDPVGQMRADYGGRPRFWLMVWPLLAWPLPFAGVWWIVPRAIRAAQRRWFEVSTRSHVLQ